MRLSSKELSLDNYGPSDVWARIGEALKRKLCYRSFEFEFVYFFIYSKLEI